jgi:hypothetical protein
MMRIVGGLAALTIAGGIVAAAPAHATVSVIGDPDDHSGYNFAWEMHYVGAQMEPWQARNFGLNICQARHLFSEDELIDRMKQGVWTPDQAIQLVRGGEYHFCYSYES